MHTTKINLDDKLPLTCSRKGNCCHGNLVMLNPWELACLASEKKITTREFRDNYCELGGIRLKFDGKIGWKNKKACSQYIENYGCSVHLGRPLACRLFPLGRLIQNQEVTYMYQSDIFPCLDGCNEVTELPQLSVEEYLKDQQTETFEMAQNEYLKLMQNLADIAFELLIDTGLAQSGDKKTLPMWRKMGNEQPEILAERIGNKWIDILTIPEIETALDSNLFILKHTDLLQQKVQETFGALQTFEEIHKASVLIMHVALNLARGLGANREVLVEHWIEIAKNNGALE